MQYIFTTHQRSCGKVMFSVLSVWLAGCSQGDGSHVTITHYALDLTVQYSSPQFPFPSDMGLHCTGTPLPGHRTLLYIESPPSPLSQVPLLVACCGHPWRPIQTCLLQDPPTSTDIWWQLLNHPCGLCKQAVCILLKCFLVAFLFLNTAQ